MNYVSLNLAYLLKLNCTPKVRHKTFGAFFLMKYSCEQRFIIFSWIKRGELTVPLWAYPIFSGKETKRPHFNIQRHHLPHKSHL